MSGDIFTTIKSVTKTNRKLLPHAEKNLLVNILIRIGNNGYVWANNALIGEWIGESKDYVKNLIMRLRKKRYLEVTGRGKKRRISVIEETVFGNSQLPNGNSQLPNAVLPIKRKQKKKLEPSADSSLNFHPDLDDVIGAIQFKYKGMRKEINDNLLLHGRAYVDYVNRMADGRIKYFRNGMNQYLAAYLDSPEYHVADWKLHNQQRG